MGTTLRLLDWASFRAAGIQGSSPRAARWLCSVQRGLLRRTGPVEGFLVGPYQQQLTQKTQPPWRGAHGDTPEMLPPAPRPLRPAGWLGTALEQVQPKATLEWDCSQVPDGPCRWVLRVLSCSPTNARLSATHPAQRDHEGSPDRPPGQRRQEPRRFLEAFSEEQPPAVPDKPNPGS